MSLTDTAVRAAKPRERPYKLTDGNGLVLIVMPKGGRWWRFRYRLGGKEQMLSLGTYPDTTLAGARELRDDARKLVAAKRNPAAVRQAERDARANTFEAIANEWLSKQKKLAATTHTKAVWLFNKVLFPALGSKPIAEITTAEMLLALKRIEATGKGETTHRAKWRAAQVFKYAIKRALATHNPVANLERGDLEPINVKHHPAITVPKDVGALLRAIDGFTGQPSTGYALRLAPLASAPLKTD